LFHVSYPDPCGRLQGQGPGHFEGLGGFTGDFLFIHGQDLEEINVVRFELVVGHSDLIRFDRYARQLGTLEINPEGVLKLIGAG
jgi:hypothetical protein